MIFHFVFHTGYQQVPWYRVVTSIPLYNPRFLSRGIVLKCFFGWAFRLFSLLPLVSVNKRGCFLSDLGVPLSSAVTITDFPPPPFLGVWLDSALVFVRPNVLQKMSFFNYFFFPFPNPNTHIVALNICFLPPLCLETRLLMFSHYCNLKCPHFNFFCVCYLEFNWTKQREAGGAVVMKHESFFIFRMAWSVPFLRGGKSSYHGNRF